MPLHRHADRARVGGARVAVRRRARGRVEPNGKVVNVKVESVAPLALALAPAVGNRRGSSDRSRPSRLHVDRDQARPLAVDEQLRSAPASELEDALDCTTEDPDVITH